MSVLRGVTVAAEGDERTDEGGVLEIELRLLRRLLDFSPLSKILGGVSVVISLSVESTACTACTRLSVSIEPMVAALSSNALLSNASTAPASMVPSERSELVLANLETECEVAGERFKSNVNSSEERDVVTVPECDDESSSMPLLSLSYSWISLPFDRLLLTADFSLLGGAEKSLRPLTSDNLDEFDILLERPESLPL